MEVVGHDYKLMQEIFFLLAVVEHDIQQQGGHPVGLQQLLLLKCAGSDEICAVSSVASVGNGHVDLSG